VPTRMLLLGEDMNFFLRVCRLEGDLPLES
jgi:hypothetical protein